MDICNNIVGLLAVITCAQSTTGAKSEMQAVAVGKMV